MIKDKNTISVHQAMLFFLTISYSPSVRVASFTAQNSKQASWLTVIIPMFIYLLLISLIQGFYKKYQQQSLMEITYEILGGFLGRVVFVLYFVWITILQALYLRYYGERLVLSLYPNVSIKNFIIVLLVLVGIITRNGIRVLARMNEIIIMAITSVFVILIIFIIPDVSIEKLTPISYLDIFPVIKGSLGVMGIWIYVFFIFLMGDRIYDKANIKSKGILAGVFSFANTFLLIICIIGTLGYSVAKRTPLSLYAAVKQISAFSTFQRIESILVSTWIFADFVLIAVFTYIVLDILKSLLNLTDITHFIGIYLAFQFVLSLFITDNLFRLHEFSGKIALPTNFLFGVLFPIIIFSIGKLKKKI